MATAPLLSTKLHIPPLGPNLVTRPRLLRRLDEGLGLGHKLTLVSAPAGFGKTTLLGEWALCLQGALPDSSPRSPTAPSESCPPSRVAWISLDTGDNDPVRFVAYLVAAVRSAGVVVRSTGVAARSTGAAGQGAGLGPNTGQNQGAISPGPWSQITPGPQPPPIKPVVAALVNEVDSWPESALVLVLDDYHLITAQPVHDAVSYLLEALPGNMHLVIASRADPPLPVARLRARGQLTELRQGDLRFEPDQAGRFLDRTAGLDLMAEDVAALTSRTEGWIAGLQMAALALQSQSARPGRESAPGTAPISAADGVGAFLQAFTGSHRFILDYLVEEVLAHQSPAIHAFLLKTSILERLTGPLCDALMAPGSPGEMGETALTGNEPPQASSQQTLQALEAANLFILPLDDERRWYRYHRLFADLLHQRLAETWPQQVPLLHRRASLWYERHVEGLDDRNLSPGAIDHALSAAIDHAFSAGDLHRTACLVEGAAERTLMRSQVATFLRWVERLPDERVRAHPDLCLFHAWALLMQGGPLEEVEARLESVEANSPLLRAKAALLRALLAMTQGEVTRAAQLSLLTLDQVPEDDTLWHSVAIWTSSLARISEGDPGEGRQALEELAHKSQQQGNVLIAAAALRHLARLHTRAGQLHEAHSTYEQVLSLSRGEGGSMLPAAGDALIGLGELWREWNDLDAAARYLLEGIDLARQWREIGTLYGYLSLARVRQAQGDPDGARNTLQTARQLAALTDTTELDDQIVALSLARLSISQGDLDAAARWAPGQASPPSHLVKYEQIVHARLLLAQGRPGQALSLLKPLLPRMLEQDRTGLAIEILILQALGLEAGGDRAGAVARLARALSLAEPGRYVRTFLDEGPPMAALLRHADARGIRPAYIATLLEAWGGEKEMFAPQAGPGRHKTLLEPLTERELEVLRQLALGLTNPEIAGTLVIATSTVHSHLKSIYGKLDVHSRWDAVRRGEELDLL